MFVSTCQSINSLWVRAVWGVCADGRVRYRGLNGVGALVSILVWVSMCSRGQSLCGGVSMSHRQHSHEDRLPGFAVSAPSPLQDWHGYCSPHGLHLQVKAVHVQFTQGCMSSIFQLKINIK